MTRLELRRTFRADPYVLWRRLTVPEEMCRWSEASVVGVATGAGGRFDVAGASRRVSIPTFGLRTVLEEEIVESEIERRLVYRVTRGFGVRGHVGEQTLVPLRNGGTALCWTVSFRGALPGVGWLMAAVLRPKLERSLDALERLQES
jgi:uncharacterized protein YndB with AHSA1/START domain